MEKACLEKETWCEWGEEIPSEAMALELSLKNSVGPWSGEMSREEGHSLGLGDTGRTNRVPLMRLRDVGWIVPM